MQASSSRELQRAIGLPRATALVVGIIIGASIFVQPSLISGEVPSVAGVLLVWAAAGILTLIGALVAAELSSAFPRTGGVYVFLREAYSPLVGFLWGWAMFWVMHTGIIAAIAMVFARYTGHFVPLGDGGLRFVAIAAIIALSAVNYVGVRQGSAVQATLTVIKVAALALIVILGAWYAVGGPAAAGGVADAAVQGADAAQSAAAPQVPTTTIIPSLGAFLAAIVAGLFAFGGWHMVTYSAEETLDPVRTIPRALVIGTVTVTALYIAVNAAYLAVLPLSTVVGSTRVAADFADALLGAGGASVMAAVVMLSTLGAITGIILAGPRVYLSMAQDGLLFGWAGAIHPRFRTPHHAIVLQAVWASVLVATGSYRALFTRVIYTEWIFFGLMAASLVILRRRPGYTPAYRVRGHPVLPAIFVASTAAIVINQVITDPIESGLGLLLVLAGIPVYLIWAGRRRQEPVPHAGD
jgi:APA family basic amino acid/polyamine antiporter